ncbi:MarR family winged helix-turn-helix transcriptional regulator [Geodermatophilus ruber]|uniref:DNA-binding transcriptional regulator, MarR family n=1 Tax=Geodermatophilus ruber TaxID=504800 RepID=A0A1I3Z5H8_9ACTN|nr:MarR family winged helix-turn-helix transcriptional regulator [Geodermatophilus ruber]SFK39293.1 DNA-binding transcriptional regulator, MarR family [Geodermatophilus ruber]
MSISPGTRDRLTAGLSRIVRTGRHLSVRAADAINGPLPSFGWALLVPLEQGGEQRSSALAARAGVDVSVASRQLATLERSGYVERRPDPADGRAVLLHLTEAGARALAATRALRCEWAAAALADWDEEDARQLGRLLERLAGDLDRAVVAAPAARAPS